MSASKKVSVLVIGAGPAGLTAAIMLARSATCDVTLLESSNHIGGLARSVRLWGQSVDLGPHRFFSYRKDVNDFWQRALDKDFFVVSRLTRILYKNRYFHYPIQFLNVVRNLGLWETIASVFSFLTIMCFPLKDESTFEGWVTNRFGRRLYKIFFKEYTEKLWGIPGSKLDANFAKQRIRGFSLGEAIIGAFRLRKSVGFKHKTLAEEFLYPAGGAGQPYENLGSEFQKLDGHLHLDAGVEKIQFKEESEKTMVFASNGGVYEADFIVSTMPITQLLTAIESTPDDIANAASHLQFRNTTLVYLLLNGRHYFKDQWIYLNSENILAGRITNFANWRSEDSHKYSDSICVLEYWSYNEDPVWKMSDDELGKLAKDEVSIARLVEIEQILDVKIIRIPKSYPVYKENYTSHLSVIKDYIDSLPGLIAIGRAGSFKYNNQDHSILMGMLAAENILGAKHDLWAINTEEDYQEK